MGITMFTLNGLFAPLQALFGAPRRVPVRSCSDRRVGNLLPAGHAPRSGQHGCPPYRPAAAPVRKPLRIVHSAAGRLVISGRMADVCAELDRLAALEAAAG